MQKRILGILGGLVLVAGLGGATALLLMTDPGEESASTGESSAVDSNAGDSTGQDQEIVLTQQEPNAVSSIDIENATGSYQVVRVEEGDAETNAVYAIAGWETVPTNTSTIWTLSNNTASMSATQVVEEDCTELEKFGLDADTAAVATLHFDDGSQYCFRIGNAAADKSLTYFATADSDTVYTVRTSLVSNFQNAASDFLSTTILEAPASESDYPIVNYLEVTRKDMDYVLRLDYDTTADDESVTGGTMSAHIMTSPVPAYLSLDRSTPVITGMFGLTADAVAVPLPEEADLAEYGLDDPFGTATMDCADGNQYVLRFSDSFTQTNEDDTTETCYYVYLEGVPAIYVVSQENLVWATVAPTDVASKLVMGTYVWDVGTLDVSVADGPSFSFVVEGDDADTAQVTLNGEPTDTERYRTFYSFLLNTTAETVDITAQQSGDPVGEIRLTTQDGSLSRTFQFYNLDSFTLLITVDGQSAYTCRRSFLDTLQHNMEIYDSDETFVTNWS